MSTALNWCVPAAELVTSGGIPGLELACRSLTTTAVWEACSRQSLAAALMSGNAVFGCLGDLIAGGETALGSGIIAERDGGACCGGGCCHQAEKDSGDWSEIWRG